MNDAALIVSGCLVTGIIVAIVFLPIIGMTVWIGIAEAE
jgi:hypothetical protein